ncbi:MAG: RDD family protein [Dehalococcoidia bacterium]|nr:RDD family protein [Dehalococcoidia bacterium]
MALAYAYSEVDFIAARYGPEELVMAGPGRRLAGAILDSLLLTVPFFLFMLALFAAFASQSAGAVLAWTSIIVGFIGLAWLIFAAQNGQSPGKQLLGMYIMKADGTRAGGWYVVLRELVVKNWLTTILSLLTGGIFGTVAPLWCIWDKNNQCLWDKLASTYVAYSPYGFKPLTANENHGPRGTGPRVPAAPGGQPQVVVNNHVQAGDNRVYAPHTTNVQFTGFGRLGILDGGRPLPEVGVDPGRSLIVGRGADADVQISEPTSSRRHFAIRLEGATWVLEDLGAMNPAQVFAGGGESPLLPGRPMRVPAGQVTIGSSVITLYPAQGG